MTALILLSEFQKTEIELWRPVRGFPGYEVSNLGRVRSYWKKSGCKRTFAPSVGRLHGTWTYVLRLDLSPTYIGTGEQKAQEYIRFSPRDKTGRIRYLSVHVEVARAFIENTRPGIAIQVNHKSHLKKDNRVGNLEWVTVSENAQRAIEAGVWPMGITHGCAKLNPDKVKEIRRRLADGENPALIALEYDVTGALIYRIRAKKIWKEVTI